MEQLLSVGEQGKVLIQALIIMLSVMKL